ncbi:MAG: hypothetical protein INR62_14150, partial [Rhodospirillales bacterium]|nr:hypothetical protein [Acetobacter sp.]
MRFSLKKSTRLQFSLASFAALSLFVSRPASGAVITFNASTGASETWGSTGNWSPNTIPGAADDVIIDYSLGTTATVLGLDGAQSANSIAFGSANGPALGPFSLLANTTGTAARTLTVTTGNFTFSNLAGA